LALRRFIRI
ncbi:glutamate synthase central domain protein, partial [Vibrio parahaemolyticus V-223/04]